MPKDAWATPFVGMGENTLEILQTSLGICIWSSDIKDVLGAMFYTDFDTGF